MKEKESYIEKQKGIFGDTTWFTYRYEVNGMVYETSAGSLDICRKARDKWMKMMSVAFTVIERYEQINMLCPYR
ncbi:hypothetical protein QNN11_23590 (plasmid) [Phocaeicola dorei]|uniref:DUF3873 domain-containing protein n=1 Tax=Phocaeicola dorei TaxID=357276 RepID=A0AA95HW13_9BACT|nr:hypothetical protein QNN11_23590 [Phocaeicola dorei]